MIAVKLFGFTYFLGVAVLASALVIILLALVGVNTVEHRVPLAYPIVGGVALMFASKFGLRAALQRAKR